MQPSVVDSICKEPQILDWVYVIFSVGHLRQVNFLKINSYEINHKNEQIKIKSRYFSYSNWLYMY